MGLLLFCDNLIGPACVLLAHTGIWHIWSHLVIWAHAAHRALAMDGRRQQKGHYEKNKQLFH